MKIVRYSGLVALLRHSFTSFGYLQGDTRRFGRESLEASKVDKPLSITIS